MPFYEYQCKKCGHELEAMQKISDAPLKKCPHCGKSQLQRLISAPVFRLKGGGWYETDFKGDKDKQRNLADRPESDTGKDTEAKKVETTEVKADAKPETKPVDKETPSKKKESPVASEKASSSSKLKKRSTKAAPKKPAKSKSKSKR